MSDSTGSADASSSPTSESSVVPVEASDIPSTSQQDQLNHTTGTPDQDLEYVVGLINKHPMVMFFETDYPPLLPLNNLLKEQNSYLEECDVNQRPTLKAPLHHLSSGFVYPQFYADGSFIGGFDDAMKYALTSKTEFTMSKVMNELKLETSDVLTLFTFLQDNTGRIRGADDVDSLLSKPHRSLIGPVGAASFFSKPIRIMSWNIMNLGQSPAKRETDLIAQFIASYEPAILVIQEILVPPVDTEHTDGTIRSTTPEVSRFLSDILAKSPNYLFELSPQKTGPHRHLNLDNPLTKNGKTPPSGKGMEYYGVLYDPRRVNTNDGVGRGFIHIHSDTDTQRLLIKNYPGPRVPFMFPFRTSRGVKSMVFFLMVVHLEDKDKDIRQQEMEYIKRFIKHSKHKEHIIILGDFNVHAEELQDFERFWNDGEIEFGSTIHKSATNSSEIAPHPYDQILVHISLCGKKPSLAAVHTIDLRSDTFFKAIYQQYPQTQVNRKISDHMPIYIDLPDSGGNPFANNPTRQWQATTGPGVFKNIPLLLPLSPFTHEHHQHQRSQSTSTTPTTPLSLGRFRRTRSDTSARTFHTNIGRPIPGPQLSAADESFINGAGSHTTPASRKSIARTPILESDSDREETNSSEPADDTIEKNNVN